MKSKLFLSSIAFYALLSLQSCQISGNKVDAQPNIATNQAQLSSERTIQTIKAANTMLVKTNELLVKSIMSRISDDKIASDVVKNIGITINTLADEVVFQSAESNAQIFAKCAKAYSELPTDLQQIFATLQNASNPNSRILTISNDALNALKALLISEDKFKAMKDDEQRVYFYLMRQDLLTFHNMLLHYIAEHIEKLEIRYDRFEILSNSASSYVSLGDEYQADISLGVSSSQAMYKLTIDGKTIPINNGRGSYKIKAMKVGKQTYSAKITVTNPLTGEVIEAEKEFSYEVGERTSGK